MLFSQLTVNQGANVVTQRFQHSQVNWITGKDDWMSQDRVVLEMEEGGWELVSCTVYPVPERTYSKTILWFKRPYEERKLLNLPPPLHQGRNMDT